MKTKARYGITVEDVSLINQSTVNALIRDAELTKDQAIRVNNAKCKNNMRNYMHDNPQLFVEHFINK